MSLSARRAWIEITVVTANDWASVVALRKESVDRNITSVMSSNSNPRSLSARRAWIEIADWADTEAGGKRRSPQGERG